MHEIPIAEYENNLRTIVVRLREVTPNVVFASTTPVHDDQHAVRKAPFDRDESDVSAYNAVSIKVMKELNVPVNDLHRIVVDGRHYTPAGGDRLADAVADCVLWQLAIMHTVRLKVPASGAEAMPRDASLVDPWLAK